MKVKRKLMFEVEENDLNFEFFTPEILECFRRNGCKIIKTKEDKIEIINCGNQIPSMQNVEYTVQPRDTQLNNREGFDNMCSGLISDMQNSIKNVKMI